jgi:preprotein translocase subunit SecE
MAKTAAEQKPRLGIFARLVRFVRQVIAELKKVVRPTRQELVTYASVVVVFVAIVMAFVGLVDFLVGKGVLAIFG